MAANPERPRGGFPTLRELSLAHNTLNAITFISRDKVDTCRHNMDPNKFTEKTLQALNAAQELAAEHFHQQVGSPYKHFRALLST